jgi:hypothetical protein
MEKFICPECKTDQFEVTCQVEDTVVYLSTVYKDGSFDTINSLKEYCGDGCESEDEFECFKCNKNFSFKMFKKPQEMTEDEKLDELKKQVAIAHKVDVDKIIEVHDKNPHINVYPRTHRHLFYSDYHNLHFYVMKHIGEPYLWLQDDETQAKAECGCKLYLKDGNPAFDFCTMHFEADENNGVLDSIHKELNGKEWSSDTLDIIAHIIRGTGREIRDPFHRSEPPPQMTECDGCGNKAPDSELIPLHEIKYPFQRIEAGGIVPSGECRKCGALAY